MREGGWERVEETSAAGSPEWAARLADKAVVVAGAAGFIGSAVAKALVRGGARRLLLLDACEHRLFELERALGTTAGCEFVLGSVGDGALLASLLRRFQPEVAIHAAAFKHVGLLERNPFAALENNVLGTHTFLRAAEEAGAERFLLLSTDKAVNPHSVMGLSKRLAEMLTLGASHGTFRASAIRLGNVIGSTGSVVPIFREQIESGGPVLVTDPEASRYFVSLADAVAAILAATAAGCDGKILLPSMGKAVRVAELAGWLIGERKIAIEYTGLRPGEKLQEDLQGAAERTEGTVEGGLNVLGSRGLSRTETSVLMERFGACLRERNLRGLLEAVRTPVPEYRPSRLMTESTGG